MKPVPLAIASMMLACSDPSGLPPADMDCDWRYISQTYDVNARTGHLRARIIVCTGPSEPYWTVSADGTVTRTPRLP